MKKTMKPLPAPMKLADADLGSVAGASGLFDFSSIGVLNYSVNSGSQVSAFNGNGSGWGSGNTSQTLNQGINNVTVVSHS